VKTDFSDNTEWVILLFAANLLVLCHDAIPPPGAAPGTEFHEIKSAATQAAALTLHCVFTVQKPYVIELSGLTSSEKQIPRNC
jgi:hypothetical protein